MISIGNLVKLLPSDDEFLTIFVTLSPSWKYELIDVEQSKLAVVLEFFTTPSSACWIRVMTINGEVGWVLEQDMELL